MVDKLTAAVADAATGQPVIGSVQVGAADGLFAAILAARSGLLVPRGETAGFLAPWSVAVLRRTELAVTLQRLGVHTLGQFAALPSRHVLARFGSDAGACHRVAEGSEGELVGLRDPGVSRRLKIATGDRDDAERPAPAGVLRRCVGGRRPCRGRVRPGSRPAGCRRTARWSPPGRSIPRRAGSTRALGGTCLGVPDPQPPFHAKPARRPLAGPPPRPVSDPGPELSGRAGGGRSCGSGRAGQRPWPAQRRSGADLHRGRSLAGGGGMGRSLALD